MLPTRCAAALIATVVLLPVAGLGSSFVQVAARTEVYRRVPPNLVAQVFATQSAMGSIGALVPTFLAGIMLDALPVRAVLMLIGVSLTAIALAAWRRGGIATRRTDTSKPGKATEQTRDEERDHEDQEDADELREHGFPLSTPVRPTPRGAGSVGVRRSMKLRVDPAKRRAQGSQGPWQRQRARAPFSASSHGSLRSDESASAQRAEASEAANPRVI